jgi:hypothetical protein
MRSNMTPMRSPDSPGGRDRSVALEMTFWRIEPLDALVDCAHRCVGKLEGVVPPPAQCSLKVYALQADGGRLFEVQVSLVGLSTCADSVCYRGSDLFETVEQAFEALLQHVCDQAETTGVRARAYPQDGSSNGGWAATGS